MITQHHHTESFLSFFLYIKLLILFVKMKVSLQGKLCTKLPSSYIVPKEYIDCRKLIQKKLKQQPKYKPIQISTKQKLNHKKIFFLDQTIKSFKANPSPNQYKETFTTIKRYKSIDTYIIPNKQNDVKGYLEVLAQDQKAICCSDFNKPRKSNSLQSLLKKGVKFNNLDDVSFIAAQIPGPGSHNPHKSIPKLKVNLQTMRDSIKKHAIQQKKCRLKNKSNLSSCSYSPIKDNTFAQLQTLPKKESTLMRKTMIDKRKGRENQVKSPGPGEHQVINKWAKQTFSREKLVGKLNLFSKTTSSFPTLSVYH